ncbi:hypothetical protein [Sulfurospirillum oryzae]|uniref:hypothetical protein n=1 Tax=Sulfurospirillum oryzae TaxID=2976535 RepID=UPI0021E823BC|nr:hypothetical protein [Sulfurospirillum oryzae]
MRFWLTLTLSLFIFAGCTTTSPKPEPYKPSTYNLSASAKKGATVNQKSTATYPGSEKVKSVPTPSTPASSETLPSSAPVTIDNTISSTTLAMATPTPSTTVEKTIDQPLEPVIAPPMARPLNDDSTMIKIAVLVPQKTIKKYAITSVNSVISYLLYKNYYFDLNVFNSGDEREESIAKALSDIQAGGYNYIIAPVTPEGANIIAGRVSDKLVFIPTLTKSNVRSAGSNIIFGGIDYDQQIALLAEKANERVGTFEDGSSLSYQLNGMIKKNSNRVFYEKRVENAKVNFKQLFKGNTSLNNASLYLNTPLVTSSLIASQLRANDIHPYALLSTQINYNPLLLTLTQYEDRDHMYIANSIQKAPPALEEINTMFGHDIVYDWVNYSTTIGADYLCQQFFDGKISRTFKEGISGNQVVYNTSLYQPGRNEFIREN